jgi:AAA15 family ATPase/GTPase
MNAKPDNLRITISNFRAIKYADISLNGITVLSGINASGKSTISKLVYYVLRGMMRYDEFVFDDLRNELRNYLNVLDSIVISLAPTYDTYNQARTMLSFNSPGDMLDIENRVSKVCDLIIEWYKEGKGIGIDGLIHRSRKMLINTLNIDESSSLNDSLIAVQKTVGDSVKKAKEKMQKRPPSLLNTNLNRSFGEQVNTKVNLTEYGEPIFSSSLSSVPIPHFIGRQFYIDTPYLLEQKGAVHWDDLNEAIEKPAILSSSLANVISKDIIRGIAKYEDVDGYRVLMFNDMSGRAFSLRIAATGIKSFSILQLLLNNGSLTKDTLLILDEPEAHLHPQWIVEYARLIIKIHKRLGVKFLIASHSTDMVSALRNIAEFEECTNKLVFYLAKRAREGKGLYNFKSIGLNIEPIFKSFNKSYDKLDSYVK